MEQKWIKCQAWIAHFDILGFKSIIGNNSNSLNLVILRETISDVIDRLKKRVAKFDENVDYIVYADTFLIYSKTNKINDYPGLISASKELIRYCISKSLPIRGAISYGEITFGHNRKILMGKAFLESLVYCEDQNWLGLILTPSASKKLKECDLDPRRHGFINKDIPMRKFSIFDAKIFAYYFINGSSNFKCPLLSFLEDMKKSAPQIEKVKYENTIKFIEKHYKTHKIS